ncbi:hypothetical protein YC2023_094878 [Brassica napus]
MNEGKYLLGSKSVTTKSTTANSQNSTSTLTNLPNSEPGQHRPARHKASWNSIFPLFIWRAGTRSSSPYGGPRQHRPARLVPARHMASWIVSVLLAIWRVRLHSINVMHSHLVFVAFFFEPQLYKEIVLRFNTPSWSEDKSIDYYCRFLRKGLLTTVLKKPLHHPDISVTSTPNSPIVFGVRNPYFTGEN